MKRFAPQRPSRAGIVPYLLCFEHVDDLGAYSIPCGDRAAHPIWFRHLRIHAVNQA
jgi:hypothetical protein